MVTMIEIDIRAVRREYDEGEIWMVAVGYGSSDLDPALKALLGPDASDKPEWPIWSAAVLDGEFVLKSTSTRKDRPLGTSRRTW